MSEIVERNLQEKALAELEKNPAYAPDTEDSVEIDTEESGISVVEEPERMEDETLAAEITEEKLATLLQIQRKLAMQQVLSQFHSPTPRHFNKKRGVGITRKNKSDSKKARKLAKKQRARNRRG
jgi:hypothetical protein